MSQPLNRESVSAVLVTQGERKFYTLTLESDILAQTCVATSRNEDPDLGFQRNLDYKRAESIRDYIERGGVIPGSIVLSAQDNAELFYDSKKKTIQFNLSPGAFLIIDGQHRVFGFKLSSKKLRVPVVIFSGLSKRDEARLFIDINTLQKSVPNELLLDIKKLAETESETEQQTNAVFDHYDTTPICYLFGLLSPRDKVQDKITRSTFLAAYKPLIKQYSQMDLDRLAQIFDAYLNGFACAVPQGVDFRQAITKPVIFRAVASVFPLVARLVGFKHNKAYTAGNFEEILRPIRSLKRSLFTQPGTSYKTISDTLSRAIDQTNTEL
ncbi:MAG: DGQHR domain-containing protein [Verrucomicrobiaceae bacterium]